jgi:trigger factor
MQASMALQNLTVEALVELVDIDPPDSLIEAEMERRVNDLGQRLQQQGATINDYINATGQTGEQLVASFREQSIPSVKADLALRAVAEAEGLEPTDEDIDAEIDRLAVNYKMKPADVRRNLERADQMPAVRSDWKKGKALEWLVSHVEIVDPEGQPIDRAMLEIGFPEADNEPNTSEPAAADTLEEPQA